MIEQGQARHRVVVVGAGFGGKYAARALRKAPADVTVINGTNHHVFEPLIYQVATGVLSPGEVATPVRELFRGQRNTEVLLGWVTDVDAENRTVTATAPGGLPYQVPYDTLIVAAGTAQSYFGNDRFAAYAPSLKSIDDAVELRSKILTAFEMAELATDPAEQERLLTFAIVGAGPTGVELAGQIAEIAHRTLPGEYRRIDPARARIVLIDAADRILPAFAPGSSASAAARLRRLGVEIRVNTTVTDVDATGVTVDGGERIATMVKVWSAGVAAGPLAARLAAATGAETDRSGRIKVEPDLTVPGHPEIFVVGDLMSLDRLPGVAQVSIQGGGYVGRLIRRRLTGRPAGKPFHYFDKGNIATVSRFSAVADLRGLRLTGLAGWLLWLGVHWAYLPKGRNRASSLIRWAAAFLGRSRPERAVTARQAGLAAPTPEPVTARPAGPATPTPKPVTARQAGPATPTPVAPEPATAQQVPQLS
ncbi:NAD(P)/FAD-dependent oxidoreductase [Actinoplanes utahensis]|uniref:NADH:ubiquinone reductase (non-electrogenic) n=1 Tax=Actinoplanes utahensis TaxID=1869 RepID=A0A0A6UXT6_ACTUT|nr:NAD(P)/FAD-dependent oxidoreductase [Actinoplanes utahensis]KHD79229.1 NADH dehydrogenase [Actinoplanes utahensis]GIF30352.1 putative NADH dehydrogenase (NDH) [Actinoplanes utahensis]